MPVPIFPTWVGRNDVGYKSCSGTQHNELKFTLKHICLLSWSNALTSLLLTGFHNVLITFDIIKKARHEC